MNSPKLNQDGKMYLPASHRPVLLSAFRQRAEGTLAKTNWPYSEHTVEAASVVLPRDCRGQFDELRLVEVAAQLIQELSWRLYRTLGHLHCKVDHQPFLLREGLALAVAW